MIPRKGQIWESPEASIEITDVTNDIVRYRWLPGYKEILPVNSSTTLPDDLFNPRRWERIIEPDKKSFNDLIDKYYESR